MNAHRPTTMSSLSAVAARIFVLGGLLVALAAGWWLAAPTSVGGANAYVRVVGSSMEPALSAGDLVVLREAEGYRVGDVAGYRSEALDRLVLHRIVAEEGGRFRLQGDNNDWVDPDSPSAGDVVGRQVTLVPGGGAVLGQATEPWGLGVLTFALVVAGGSRVRRGSPRRRHAARRQLAATTSGIAVVSTVSVLAGVLGLACASLAHWGPAAASEQTSVAPGGAVPTSAAGPRSVTFSYRTEVPRSAAYDGTTVRSPQPVFRSLTDTVDVGFEWRGGPATLDLAALLSTTGGWRSRVPLGSLEVTGEQHRHSVRLDLAALERRAQRAAAVTGVPAGEIRLSVEVTDPGAPRKFAASFPLVLSPVRLAVAGDPEGDGAATTTVREEAATPTSSVGGDVSLGDHAVDRAAVWGAAALLLGIALASGAVLHVRLRRRLSAGDPLLARRRYGSVLVESAPVPLPVDRPVVEVTSLTALARLAERSGLVVLHWVEDGAHTYAAHDDAATYRFRS